MASTSPKHKRLPERRPRTPPKSEAADAHLLDVGESGDRLNVCSNGCGHYLARSLGVLLFTSPMNLLLLCTPLAFYAQATRMGDAPVFLFSLLAIAPFAERLSFVTEQLALHTSSVLGGLLNATFGAAAPAAAAARGAASHPPARCGAHRATAARRPHPPRRHRPPPQGT